MESIFNRLKDFLPSSMVYQKHSDYDGYEIFDMKTDNQIGIYTLNEAEELSSFTLEAVAETGKATKGELVVTAQKFINTFHFDKKDQYELSAIIDLGDSYLISFEKRDKRYGIFLHSEGFTVTISTTGQVQQFFYAKEDYRIVYPETLISEGEAKEIYLAHLRFNLDCRKFDKETFINGDDQDHLAYSVVEHAYEIPADGREPAVIKEEISSESISLEDRSSIDSNQLLEFTNEEKSNKSKEKNSKPLISLQEAKEIYKNLLKMELLFVREYDESYVAVYTLSYGPTFPEMFGHVRAVDAMTGKAMYVDMGNGTFY